MAIGILSLQLSIPFCTTLKQKRSSIKPLLHRIHREYNVSIAETGLLDKTGDTVITAALVSNETAFISQYLQKVIIFITNHFSEFEIIDHRIEII